MKIHKKICSAALCAMMWGGVLLSPAVAQSGESFPFQSSERYVVTYSLNEGQSGADLYPGQSMTFPAYGHQDGSRQYYVQYVDSTTPDGDDPYQATGYGQLNDYPVPSQQAFEADASSNVNGGEDEFFVADATQSAVAEEILRLTNSSRAQHGLAPLQWNGSLNSAAFAHSEEMLTLNYFSHTSPTPGRGDPSSRVRAAGVNPSRVAENIFQADGYPLETIAEVTVDTWLRSPGHRANILDPQVTHIGIGVAQKDDQVSVTQVFGGGLR